MKLAFFVSSVGDTDLALSTIKALETKGKHDIHLIALTKTAQDRIAGFESSLVKDKITLVELLAIENGVFPTNSCTAGQIEQVVAYIDKHKVNQVYCGVPSVNSEIPFQIAKAQEKLPVLIAYEFMFKPESHSLWEFLPALKSKSNVQWAIPLSGAKPDFSTVDKNKVHVVGHLSIDNAFPAQSTASKTEEELRLSLQAEKEKLDAIRKNLQIGKEKSFAFVSSTTQPVAIDKAFLDCLLQELPKHTNIEVCLGLHPGIIDLDTYLTEILAVYQKHHDECSKQFKIILTDSLFAKLKKPELTATNPDFKDVFLRANINGNDAAWAADRVAQAVPGALLNQGVLEGKPAYSHFGKPYLSSEFFSTNVNAFFKSERQKPHTKEELGLDSGTASEHCAELLLKMR